MTEAVEESQDGTIVIPRAVLDMIQSAPAGVEILTTAIGMAVFLSGKNIAYGNSFEHPVGVFSKLSPLEQLRVRMDDKLRRIQNGTEYGDEDSIRDLLGYLMLYFMLLQRNEENGIDGNRTDETPGQT